MECDQLRALEKRERERGGIKTLSDVERTRLAEINKGRKLNRMKQIPIKVRKCLACERLFESDGRFTCGCAQDSETPWI